MNVFLILSPLQMINALEAKHHFGLPTSDCTLVTSSSAYKQFLEIGITTRCDWGKIIKYSENSGWFIGFRHALKEYSRIASEIGVATNIFFASYASLLSHHFINHIKYKNIYLLDDGNVTRHICNYRNDPTRKNGQLIFTKPFKGLIKKTVFRIGDREIRELNYFTIYNLKAKKNEKVIKNEYQLLRKSDAPVIVNEVHFLGSPMVELGITTVKTYFRYMKGVSKYFEPLDVVYFPHRRESIWKITRLSAELGIKIRRNAIPVECLYVKTNSVPKNLSAFFSSAIDNCKCLFGNNMAITCFYLNRRDISPAYRYGIESEYQYLRSGLGKSFEIISL